MNQVCDSYSSTMAVLEMDAEAQRHQCDQITNTLQDLVLHSCGIDQQSLVTLARELAEDTLAGSRVINHTTLCPLFDRVYFRIVMHSF